MPVVTVKITVALIVLTGVYDVLVEVLKSISWSG